MTKYDKGRKLLFGVLDKLFADFTMLQILGFIYEYCVQREARAKADDDDPTHPEYWRDCGRWIGKVIDALPPHAPLSADDIRRDIEALQREVAAADVQLTVNCSRRPATASLKNAFVSVGSKV